MKKLNNKGLTLVELIIAVAMSTIVIGATTAFLYNAERSYRISQYSVDLQMESQVLMEQLSNWIMESNRIEIADAGKALVLYHIPVSKPQYNETGTEPLPDTNTKYSRTIIYNRNGKLYVEFTDTDDPSTYISEIQAGGSATYACLGPTATLNPVNCIGEHVEFFDIYVPNGMDSSNLSAVEIKLSMKEGNAGTQAQSYIISDIFSLRNSVYKAATPAPTNTPEPSEP